MSLLSVKNIKKSYGSNLVLDDISFEINKGEILALVGPNGSGKSTLLNIIANILTEDSGSVEIFGMSNKNVDVFKNFSYMIDNTVLYEYLTGLDHMKFISDMQDLPSSDIGEYADLLGIKHFLNKKVGEYSLGMKQQLLFTMSLMNDPDLLIMDEPFNGLDPTTIIKVRKIIIDRYNRGKTVLVSSHNLSEVHHMTPHVLFLKDGKLLDEDISKYQKNIYYFKVEDINKISTLLDKEKYEIIDEEIVISVEGENLNKIIKQISDISEITGIRTQTMGTEERYKEIFHSN